MLTRQLKKQCLPLHWKKVAKYCSIRNASALQVVNKPIALATKRSEEVPLGWMD